MRDKLNQWVIDKMNQHGLSMRQLAEQAGLDHSTLSKVVAGKREPCLDFYVKIAQALNALPEMLIVAGLLSPDGGDLGFTEDERELIAEYRALHPLGREATRGLVKEFLERQGKYF